MKKLFYLSISLLLALPSLAATYSVDWDRTSEAELTNVGTAIARDADNNVYATSWTTGIYLTKWDQFGNFLWQVSSFTTLQFNYEYPAQVHIDPQGNPVVVGYRYTSPSEGRPANSLIVLKYDAAGNLIYKKNIDGDYSYFSSSPMSMYWTKISSQMDASGNVYIGTSGGVDGYPDDGFTVVKVTPAGNIAWVSTKVFSSPTNFHFVSNMRVKGNKIGLTGFTEYPHHNVTNWVLDTTGTSKFSNIKDGGGGADVTFDNSGNAFFLASVSVSSVSDIKIFRFSGSGILKWEKSYDFGGSELPARLELAPDNNIVVMAYGNKYPGGSLYVDWITFKIKRDGTLKWSIRYDKHTGNDEIPRAMAIDTDGDIFITGIAGPFPGGSNLGRQQMVTVKYSSAGRTNTFHSEVIKSS